MRTTQAIVAIILNGYGRFLVTFNAKWGGYAFPMIAVPEGGDILGSLAIQAAEHDLGCRLPDATAAELDYMGHYSISQRTGEETWYEYWLYTVEPNQVLDLLAAPKSNNNPPMFLTYAELTSRTDLTWSTPAIAKEFVVTQESVLAVVIREIDEELGLTPAECPVAATVTHHLEYRAISRSAGELTQYTMELFDAQPTAAGLEKITRDPMNKWLDEDEIRRLEAYDGRVVSVTMGMLLGQAGVM